MTSKDKLKELQQAKEQRLQEKAETLAIKKLYESKFVFDNSKNKTTNRK